MGKQPAGGPYRIVHEIQDDPPSVRVVRIDHRADVYRKQRSTHPRQSQRAAAEGRGLTSGLRLPTRAGPRLSALLVPAAINGALQSSTNEDLCCQGRRPSTAQEDHRAAS